LNHIPQTAAPYRAYHISENARSGGNDIGISVGTTHSITSAASLVVSQFVVEKVTIDFNSF